MDLSVNIEATADNLTSPKLDDTHHAVAVDNDAPPAVEQATTVAPPKELWAKLERERGIMTLRFSVLGFGLFMGLAMLIIVLNDSRNLGPVWRCSFLLLVIMSSGMVGGSLSMVRRLQAITPRCGDANLETSFCSLWRAGITSCLLGGIFAVILIYIFLTGALKGPLFPAFEGAEQIGATLPTNLSLATMAKVVVFSFLAGFAERLVPDALDRLVAASKAPSAPAK